MKHRPKYLDLKRIRLPLPGFVSILHRASGLIIYLSIPLLLFLLQESLDSGQSFSSIAALLSYFPAKIMLIFLLWAFFHHFCAGIRFLLLDMGIGLPLESARASSRWVMILSLVLTVAAGVRLW